MLQIGSGSQNKEKTKVNKDINFLQTLKKLAEKCLVLGGMKRKIVKDMNFLEALNLLLQKCDELTPMYGGIIRRPHHFGENGIISGFGAYNCKTTLYGLDGVRADWNLTIQDYLATDWEWRRENPRGG